MRRIVVTVGLLALLVSATGLAAAQGDMTSGFDLIGTLQEVANVFGNIEDFFRDLIEFFNES